MTLSYVSTDAVNASTLRHLAGRLGLVVRLTDPRCRRPRVGCRAVIYDVDFLPAEILSRLLSAASAGRSLRRVAVHSYNLSPRTIRVLRAAGATVGRRLTTELLHRFLPDLRPVGDGN